MKTINRIISLLIVSLTIISFVGCGYVKGEPQLEDTTEMFLGAYCPPYPTDEAYKWVAECGITHMMVADTHYLEEFDVTDAEYCELPFEYGAKYGVKIMMQAGGASYQVHGENLEAFKERENFGGFLIVDEPSAKRFDYYAKDYAKFVKDFPDTPYLINLLPNYSTTKQLGGVTYEEYVRLYNEKLLSKYVPTQRILMCDCYPLLKSGTYQEWLYNLELLRETADSVDGDLYLFIQAQGFLEKWRQPTSVADLTYQMYVYLAYGAKGMAFYPYKMPESSLDYEKGIVDTDGKKTYMYALAQSMSMELKKIDGVYLGFDWKAVIAKAGKRNIDGTNVNFAKCKNLKDSYGILKSVESTYDTIVGCFENENGYQGFMAVNFNDPSVQKETDITLNFKSANKAIVYIKGEPTKVDLNDGKYTGHLGMGEGIFIVPYNG